MPISAVEGSEVTAPCAKTVTAEISIANNKIIFFILSSFLVKHLVFVAIQSYEAHIGE
jgi:hypothetical protein